MIKAGPRKTSAGDYVTSQKEFWAIMDPKTMELVCSNQYGEWAIPRLFEKKEFAEGNCGAKGRVVKVTLSW